MENEGNIKPATMASNIKTPVCRTLDTWNIFFYKNQDTETLVFRRRWGCKLLAEYQSVQQLILELTQFR